MLTNRQGLMAVALGLAMISCAEDEIKPSDLNTEGPPRVITVTVFSEAAGDDVASYCAPEDRNEKLSEFYCPRGENGEYIPVETVMDADPLNPQIRILFNEHLLPEYVETIVEGVGTLAETQPVELTCGGQPVAYDGYYLINGSHLTFPSGPAIVVQPLDFIATSTADCQVTVKEELYDRDFQKVTERGPYPFGIASLKLVATEPPDEEEGADPCTPPALIFNALLDDASIDPASIVLEKDGEAVPITIEVSNNEVYLVPTTEVAAGQPLEAEASYTVRVIADSMFADIAGGSAAVEETTATFETGELPADGCMPAM